LRATHQSGRGMLEVFSKFADMEAEITYGHNSPLVTDHPLSRERIDLLQQIVESSPYKDVKDSPQAVRELQLIQAKLAGFLDRVNTVLQRYPPSDASEEGHYARAIAYFRQPDMKNALAEANTLVKLDSRNPFFWEVLGQIYVEMSQPLNGILPYQKAVDLAPDEPLLRLDLAAAQIAAGKPQFAKPALDNLKTVLRQENNNSFAWYETAQAYSDAGNEPMANLSTAELNYANANFSAAAHFATLAQHKLAAGSPDWQRATDILAVSAANSDKRR
jgi:predicted Zn-dependent protease